MKPHNYRKLAIKVNGKTKYVEDPTKNFATVLLVGTIGLSLGLDLGTDWKHQLEVKAMDNSSNLEQQESRLSPEQSGLVELSIADQELEISSGDLVTNKKSGQSLTGSSDEVSVEQIIEQVFGDQAENAKKIAQCESGMNPENIGDTHIMGVLDGEMVGDSIGLFQIRTGDAGVYDSKPWNRAKANGMTVEEFRTYLKNPENNIKYAKQIFERSGWGAWHNCAVKEGIR